MLTSIILNNYTTFINETKFDFKATNIYHSLEDTNVAHNVLKGALFVGENASGKTQTLKSIVFLLDILLGNSDTNFLEKKSLYTNGKNYNLTYTFLVDEKNIEEMFAILESFQLDYILTSQALWCDYKEVRDISICELIKAKNASSVAIRRYRWNGKVKEVLN